MSVLLRVMFVLGSFCCLMAQEPLNNDGVIKLVKSGMTEELIINVIQKQPGIYSLGATDLVLLKESSVSEKIIAAMLSKAAGQPAPGVASGASVSGAGLTTRTSVTQPGLYYKKGDAYYELLGEEVEWRTRGAMKNIVSAGIVKKNMTGRIVGPSSRNFLTNPLEILLSPPEGITVNSYILLPMTPKDGQRQFNVGPVNQKSGVARGAIPFGVEKVGANVFRIVLQTPLSPGEYGILTATPVESAVEPTKMNTFRILL